MYVDYELSAPCGCKFCVSTGWRKKKDEIKNWVHVERKNSELEGIMIWIITVRFQKS